MTAAQNFVFRLCRSRKLWWNGKCSVCMRGEENHMEGRTERSGQQVFNERKEKCKFQPCDQCTGKAIS